MFLNSWKPRRDDEDGAVLIAVIGFAAVALLVITLMSTTVVTGAGRTSAARATVQSQAAAEAGVDAARAVVDANACTSSTIDNSASSAAIRYKVQISWRSNSSAAWSARCPVYQRGQVKYTATGYAPAGSVMGQTSGDKSYVEAVYGSPTVSAIDASGAALYSWGVDAGTGMTGLIGSISGTNAKVQIYNGSASCSGALTLGALSLANISANIQVRNGNYNISACSLTGNVAASGSVTMNGSDDLHVTQITGSVNAASLNMIGYSTLTNGATLPNNTSALVKTPVGKTLAGIPLGGLVGNQSPDLRTPPGVTVAAASAPAVPGWTEWDYQGASQWPGFVVKTLTTDQCNTVGINLILSGLLSSQSVVVDAQACPASTFQTLLNVSLTNSVALIVPNNAAITMNLASVSLPTGLNTKLWIVQPDADVTDNKPTCPTGGSITISGLAALNLAPTMVYTPCAYNETSLIGAANGQVYAGTINLSTAISLGRTYTPIGLPGVDLNAASSTATGPRGLLSTRNVQTGP
jgi:hypothetical protein